jgi:acetyltransferase-like isoleucine patch superfamily enzyme
MLNKIKSIILIFVPDKLYFSYLKIRMTNKYLSKNLIVGKNIRIENVKFGNHIYLGDNTKLSNVSISDHSYINSNTNIKNSKIGKYCSIASNVNINLGNHPSEYISSHPAFYSTNKPYKTFADKDYYEEFLPTQIGNDVWIGFNAIILGNINIGDGSIIAAGAVVTKDVEPYSIVGGVPAKHIKYRFNENTRNELKRKKWWDKSEKWIHKNFKLFHNKSNIEKI